MKHCVHCGAEIRDDATMCPHCGCLVETAEAPAASANDGNKYKALAILSTVFGVLGGFLGLVLGIIGFAIDKSKKNDVFYWIGAGGFLVWLGLFVFLQVVLH